MKLYHVTNRQNLDSINARGLDPLMSFGIRKAVWAGVASKAAWAIVHTLGKKRNAGLTVADVVVLEIEVPRSWLTRYQTGVWYCYRNIPASRIIAIHDAAEYGASAE